MVAGADIFRLEYAQVGYLKIAGMAAPKAFTEYNDGTSIDDPAHWRRLQYNGIWSSGAQHAYVVDHNAITEKLYMQIDGLTKSSTPWSPNVVWSNPWSAQYFGETQDRGDDVPGTAGIGTSGREIAEAALHHELVVLIDPISGKEVISVTVR